MILIFWPIDRLQRVSLRTHVNDIPPQDVITRDNVSIKVNAVVYFRVIDAMKAILEVEDYLFATRLTRSRSASRSSSSRPSSV